MAKDPFGSALSQLLRKSVKQKVGVAMQRGASKRPSYDYRVDDYASPSMGTDGGSVLSHFLFGNSKGFGDTKQRRQHGQNKSMEN